MDRAAGMMKPIHRDMIGPMYIMDLAVELAASALLSRSPFSLVTTELFIFWVTRAETSWIAAENSGGRTA